MQKIKKSGVKNKEDKVYTLHPFCKLKSILKVAFTQNLQIIYPIKELSNSFLKDT